MSLAELMDLIDDYRCAEGAAEAESLREEIETAIKEFRDNA